MDVHVKVQEVNGDTVVPAGPGSATIGRLEPEYIDCVREMKAGIRPGIGFRQLHFG